MYEWIFRCYTGDDDDDDDVCLYFQVNSIELCRKSVCDLEQLLDLNA